MDIEIIKKEIGKRIKNLRKEKGESQEDLGKILGVCQNSISKLERGESSLSLETQYKIAEHFNVSHDFICTGVDDNSILKLLNQNFYIEYKAELSYGKMHYCYPVLKINKIFFAYLHEIAKIELEKKQHNLPDDVSNLWIDNIVNKFYEKYKKNKKDKEKQYIEFFPLIKEFIYPDGEKKDWNQTDLLREACREFSKLIIELYKS